MIDGKPNEFAVRSVSDPFTIREPIRLFDDLFFTGNRLIGIYILKTSDGLVLFDSSDMVDGWEQMLQPALQKLGLEQEPVRILFLTHGHFDHYLGAKKIQEATGCRVALSETDTAYMGWCRENARPERMILPHVDLLVQDGEDVVIGDHTVHVILAPGHTPGCLNYVFPVHEGEQEHHAVMAGGYGVFGPDRFPEEPYPYGLQWAVDQALLFAGSQIKTWEYCKANGVDVFFNPHPHLCGLFEYLEENEKRADGEPTALVIGLEGVRKWLVERFDYCMKSVTDFSDIQKPWEN